MTDYDADTKTKAFIKLREPFPPEMIGKLPRVTCKDCSNKNCQKHQRTKCQVCNAFISTAHIHLDFVGHAELTDRLLTVDPEWNWEPVAFGEDGLPKIADTPAGPRLWIKLTIVGVTRLGVGSVERGAFDIEKQLIGDALRNAAMRFGVALDLWAKSDLAAQATDDGSEEAHTPPTTRRSPPTRSSTAATAPQTPSEGNGATNGSEGVSAKDRNRITAHLARLDPPVRGDASVNAHLTAILNLPEPLEGIVKLTEAQGAQVIEYLGIAP